MVLIIGRFSFMPISSLQRGNKWSQGCNTEADVRRPVAAVDFRWSLTAKRGRYRVTKYYFVLALRDGRQQSKTTNISFVSCDCRQLHSAPNDVLRIVALYSPDSEESSRFLPARLIIGRDSIATVLFSAVRHRSGLPSASRKPWKGELQGARMWHRAQGGGSIWVFCPFSLVGFCFAGDVQLRGQAS